MFRSTQAEELEDDNLDVLEQRIDSITLKLEDMQREVVALRNPSKPEKLSLVIEADPCFPPECIRTLLKHLLNLPITATITTHSHSSLIHDLPQHLCHWVSPHSSGCSRIDNQFNLTWIWKPVGRHPIAKEVDRPTLKEFHGQACIARLIARFIESWTETNLYESCDLISSALIDQWMDSVELEDESLSKRLESRLEHFEWLVGQKKTLADVFVASSLKDRLTSKRMKEWALRCCSF